MRDLVQELREAAEIKTALAKRILKALKKYEFGTEALADHLGDKEHKLKPILKRMQAAGQIKFLKTEKLWELA